MDKETRKIIQISTALAFDNNEEDTEETLFALCDDGTVWALGTRRKRWVLMKPIPQDEPNHKEYLDREINCLIKKEREKGLNNDEKENLKDLIRQKQDYELYRC